MESEERNRVITISWTMKLHFPLRHETWRPTSDLFNLTGFKQFHNPSLHLSTSRVQILANHRKTNNQLSTAMIGQRRSPPSQTKCGYIPGGAQKVEHALLYTDQAIRQTVSNRN